MNKIKMMIVAVAAMMMIGCAGIQVPKIEKFHDNKTCKTMTISVKEQATQDITFTVPAHAPDFTKWASPKIKPLWGASDGILTSAVVAINYSNADHTKVWSLVLWYTRQPAIGGETDTMQWKETAEVMFIREQHIEKDAKVNMWYDVRNNECSFATKQAALDEITKRIIAARNTRGI